jgi:folate-binding protein YgfZ
MAPDHSEATEAEYDARRIALGVPEGGVDFAFGDAFPHDADMDQLGGVDFKKGCYIGQEVVSRMEHRGTARRRFVIATGASPLPDAGTAVMAGERAVGTLGSHAGATGIALVRLDRVKEAMDARLPIIAGGTTLSLSLPPWAKFGWPAAATVSASVSASVSGD